MEYNVDIFDYNGRRVQNKEPIIERVLSENKKRMHEKYLNRMKNCKKQIDLFKMSKKNFILCQVRNEFEYYELETYANSKELKTSKHISESQINNNVKYMNIYLPNKDSECIYECKYNCPCLHTHFKVVNNRVPVLYAKIEK